MEDLWARLVRLVDHLAPAACSTPDFENYLAFRWVKVGVIGRAGTVAHPHLFELSELVGIEDVIEEVVRNTRQFISGCPANNVLLWGERGCGKSSVVKGLLKPFSGEGLRIVELKRWDIMALPQIVALLREAPYYFILFCDDLSFDEGEGDYRALKTLLDGDIEARPSNVLFLRYIHPSDLLMLKKSGIPVVMMEIHPDRGGKATGWRCLTASVFPSVFYSLDQEEYLCP
jgi:predicted AAA+ superfamily ATPase